MNWRPLFTRFRYLQTVGGKKKLYVSQTRPSKTPGVLGAPTCLAQHRKKDPNFQPDYPLVLITHAQAAVNRA